MYWNTPLSKLPRVCFLSTFSPRKCGIAVFTEDLMDNIDITGQFAPSRVIAIRKADSAERYGERVEWQIEQDKEVDYIRAAEQINKSNFDIVNIQHEFGIFGGNWGSHILSFLKHSEKPVVTSLHTVQPDFKSEPQKILEEIVYRSRKVITTSNIATSIIVQYGLPTENIEVIQHGCPDVPFTNSESCKVSLNLQGKKVLCTFGLISKGKGLEYAIQALPAIVAKNPEILYLIIGETHPEVKKTEDEEYRTRLTELVRELKLQNHVIFQNRFLPKAELIRYLQATDVYVTPYLGKNQISSGTLIYALGTGRAVVSTPYLHAQEVLSGGRGLLCEFRSPSSIAKEVNRLLSDKELKSSIERKAYEYSRRFTWFEVAKQYAQLFKKVLADKEKEQPIELSSSIA